MNTIAAAAATAAATATATATTTTYFRNGCQEPTDSSDVSESESLEDYDTLKLDPMSIITGGKGGGLDIKTNPATPVGIPQTVYAELKIPSQKSRHGLARREPKKRVKFSDLVFTKKFTAFDRHNNIVANSPFMDFSPWLACCKSILRLILSVGIIAERGFGVAWELLYLALVVSWTLFREWPWTHTVFFVLHGIVMMMKQHSYAFYNGHLSEEYTTRSKLNVN
ncbi:hypothetical protein DID88_006838 [Monilinia fructigena]|uniref:Uncharacterized protein n=1 Tax=Monilinia fructigena TaxID=38457 RepID=A0A395IG50_9HELO|nr:hypothetical protein DID88_006838 [Monilinia fructigena]